MLVGMAYAFEQRWAARETPWSVPPLRGGDMLGPIPVKFDPTVDTGRSASVDISFTLRPALNRLEYQWTAPNLRDDAVMDATLRVPRRDGGVRMVHLLEDALSWELVGGGHALPVITEIPGSGTGERLHHYDEASRRSDDRQAQRFTVLTGQRSSRQAFSPEGEAFERTPFVTSDERGLAGLPTGSHGAGPSTQTRALVVWDESSTE